VLLAHAGYQEQKKRGKSQLNYIKVLSKYDMHFYKKHEKNFRHLQAFFVVVLQFDLPH